MTSSDTDPYNRRPWGWRRSARAGVVVAASILAAAILVNLLPGGGSMYRAAGYVLAAAGVLFVIAVVVSGAASRPSPFVNPAGARLEAQLDSIGVPGLGFPSAGLVLLCSAVFTLLAGLGCLAVAALLD